MLMLESLQPAMMQQAVAVAQEAQADGGLPDRMETLGSEGLAAGWSAALRESPSDSPAAHQRRMASPHIQDASAPDAAAASPAAAAQLPHGALLAAWAEAAADVSEALAAAADLVAACGAMGRLQAVLEAEEQRARFAATVLDLKLALSGLQAVQCVAPADVGEDVAAVQRQLAALHFASSGRQEQLTGQLLEVRLAAGCGWGWREW